MNRLALIASLAMFTVSIATAQERQPVQEGVIGAKQDQVVEQIRVQPKAITPGNPNAPVSYRAYEIRPEIWTDRQQLTLGDRIRLFFRVNEDSYVYIYNTDAAGRKTQIFPNYFDQSNRVRAGFTYAIPDGSYDLTVTPPAGTETITIMALADDYPDIRRYGHNYSATQPFAENFKDPRELIQTMERANSKSAPAQAAPRYGQEVLRTDKPESAPRAERYQIEPAPAEARAITPDAIRPVPVTPPAYYPSPVYRYGIKSISLYTRDPYQRPPVVPYQIGSLRISTSPSRANIYVNGEFVGRTSDRIHLEPGYHNVEITKNGFKPELRKIHISPGEHSSMSLRLQPIYKYNYDIQFGFHSD
jgi:hypothetical protein